MKKIPKNITYDEKNTAVQLLLKQATELEDKWKKLTANQKAMEAQIKIVSNKRYALEKKKFTQGVADKLEAIKARELLLKSQRDVIISRLLLVGVKNKKIKKRLAKYKNANQK